MPSGLAALARLAVLPSGGDQVTPMVISQLNTSLGAALDGEQLHAGRVTRHAVWAALVAATAIVLIVRGTGEDAAALTSVEMHAGVPGLLAALLGGQVAVALTREAHLFRYVRTR